MVNAVKSFTLVGTLVRSAKWLALPMPQIRRYSLYPGIPWSRLRWMFKAGKLSPNLWPKLILLHETIEFCQLLDKSGGEWDETEHFKLILIKFDSVKYYNLPKFTLDLGLISVINFNLLFSLKFVTHRNSLSVTSVVMCGSSVWAGWFIKLRMAPSKKSGSFLITEGLLKVSLMLKDSGVSLSSLS